MALRTVCWNGCLLLVLSGCGSATVDAGTLGNGGSGGTAMSDAGDPTADGRKACAIPDLASYRLVFDSDGGRLERRIYSMRADGSELVALTPPEELAREPAMSPDGSKLAYVTPEGVKLLDMASRQSELLVPGGDQPAWSADGASLVYRVPLYGGYLELRSISDGVTQPLASYDAQNPELLPDGTTVLLDLKRLGNADLWLSTIQSASLSGDGHDVVPLSSVTVTHPTLSPDGVWVAAAMQCPGSDRLSLWASPYAVSTPPCEGRRITPLGVPNATNPKWGPGVLIAYERGEPPRDIAIIAADTGEECVIGGPGDDRNPSWAVHTFTPPE